MCTVKPGKAVQPRKALDVAIKSSTEGLMLKQLDAEYKTLGANMLDF